MHTAESCVEPEPADCEAEGPRGTLRQRHNHRVPRQIPNSLCARHSNYLVCDPLFLSTCSYTTRTSCLPHALPHASPYFCCGVTCLLVRVHMYLGILISTHARTRTHTHTLSCCYTKCKACLGSLMHDATRAFPECLRRQGKAQGDAAVCTASCGSVSGVHARWRRAAA
jgi:hypothetical protein